MTLTAPTTTVPVFDPEPFAMDCPTTPELPGLPAGFGQFLDPDTFAQLRAMQADLHARVLALVPLVVTAVEADTIICEQLAAIAHRAKVLYDDFDPQARAFEALLTAVGNVDTASVFWAISAGITRGGPGALAALIAIEDQIGDRP